MSFNFLKISSNYLEYFRFFLLLVLQELGIHIYEYFIDKRIYFLLDYFKENVLDIFVSLQRKTNPDGFVNSNSIKYLINEILFVDFYFGGNYGKNFFSKFGNRTWKRV